MGPSLDLLELQGPRNCLTDQWARVPSDLMSNESEWEPGPGSTPKVFSS